MAATRWPHRRPTRHHRRHRLGAKRRRHLGAGRGRRSGQARLYLGQRHTKADHQPTTPTATESLVYGSPKCD